MLPLARVQDLELALTLLFLESEQLQQVVTGFREVEDSLADLPNLEDQITTQTEGDLRQLTQRGYPSGGTPKV